MDPFYAFLIFAVLIALETFVSQSWRAPYFRFGIPISVLRRPLDDIRMQGTRHTSETHSSERLARQLEQRFLSRPQHPSIQFKQLPGSPPGEADLAFRERLFENRGGFKYLPVMHSLARLRPDQHSLTVTGYLNWYVVYILGYLVYRTLDDRSFAIVAILILFVLALSYAGQAAINAQVAEEIQSLPGRQAAPAGSQE